MSAAPAPVRWGILGPGTIARDFRAGTAGSATGVIAALGTRNPDKPELAEHFPGIRIVTGYEALIADPEIDAIYIATPHAHHVHWAIAAAQGGKHVLCEKPMGVCAAETEAMFLAAQAAGTFLGEAFMYRFHPLASRIVALIRADAIGEVRMIRSSFGFAVPEEARAGHRLFQPELGGGAILDLAGYPVSMAGLIAGARNWGGIPVPDRIRAVAHFGPGGIDEWTSALLRFPGGITADLSCSISVRQENVLHVMGTTGRLEIDQFWFAGGKTGGVSTIRLIRPDGSREDIPVEEPRHLYSFQFEAANAAIQSGATEFAHPGLDAADSIATARIVDRWLEEIRA